MRQFCIIFSATDLKLLATCNFYLSPVKIQKILSTAPFESLSKPAIDKDGQFPQNIAFAMAAKAAAIQLNPGSAMDVSESAGSQNRNGMQLSQKSITWVGVLQQNGCRQSHQTKVSANKIYTAQILVLLASTSPP